MAVSHTAADAIIERVEIFNAQNTAGIKLKPLGIYRSAHADSARTKRGRTFIDKEAKNIAELTEDVIFRLMIKYKCDVHTGKHGKPDICLEAAVYERAMNSKAPVMAAYTSPQEQEKAHEQAQPIHDEDGEIVKTDEESQPAKLPEVDMLAFFSPLLYH
jgi:hypothetical protein